MRKVSLLVFIVIEIVSGSGGIESPCPEQFLYEPNRSQDDRWYGIINLRSEVDITGVTLQLQFDKSVIELGNYLGRVNSNDDNTKFTIRNEKKRMTAHASEKVRIFVVYNPSFDVEPPNLSKIALNGREICPHIDEQEVESEDEHKTSSNIRQPNCGIRKIAATPLITQGQYTRPGDWPWQAAIYWKEVNQRKFKCSGTLISEHHVLTAAHCTTLPKPLYCITNCTYTPRDPEDISVILGKHGLYILNGRTEQTIEVSKISVHPQFNVDQFFNDISIIRLKRSAQMTNYVRYICLWNDDSSLSSIVGKIGTAVGWGRDHNDNQLTDLLMQAEMPVVDTLTCVYSYPEVFGRFTNNENNFCAGFRNGTSVCNGDSGGGLMFPVRGTSEPQWQIRGIVSNTVAKIDGSCDPNHYVVFTDVAKYSDWIKNIMKT